MNKQNIVSFTTLESRTSPMINNRLDFSSLKSLEKHCNMISRNLVAHPSGSSNAMIIGSNLRSVSLRQSYCAIRIVLLLLHVLRVYNCLSLFVCCCSLAVSRYKRKCIVVSLNLFSQHYVLLLSRVNW